jgi:hypothetical protein
MPVGFDQHRWHCYYRDGEFHQGKRKPRWW